MYYHLWGKEFDMYYHITNCYNKIKKEIKHMDFGSLENKSYIRLSAAKLGDYLESLPAEIIPEVFDIYCYDAQSQICLRCGWHIWLCNMQGQEELIGQLDIYFTFKEGNFDSATVNSFMYSDTWHETGRYTNYYFPELHNLFSYEFKKKITVWESIAVWYSNLEQKIVQTHGQGNCIVKPTMLTKDGFIEIVKNWKNSMPQVTVGV